jgi:hypothetical protein
VLRAAESFSSGAGPSWSSNPNNRRPTVFKSVGVAPAVAKPASCSSATAQSSGLMRVAGPEHIRAAITSACARSSCAASNAAAVAGNFGAKTSPEGEVWAITSPASLARR